MRLPFGFGYLDWDDWVQGLISAVISGGANAAYGAFGAAVIDGDHFKAFGSNFFHLGMGIFAFAGFVSGMNFLRTKSFPGRLVVKNTVETTLQRGEPAKVVMTTEETHTESAHPTASDSTPKEKP